MKSLWYKLTHWETWHYLAKYIPLAPMWLYYCLRARSFWFFTPSNPTLTFGGFEGESKREMYDQLPPGTFPISIYIEPGMNWERVESIVQENKFSYPFAVKPDVGMMGLMFRQIRNATDFRRYHEIMPVTYIVQELIDLPLEVSVFYYRHPGEQTGNITGFLKKEFPTVVGDGCSTLLQLIQANPRISSRVEELSGKHKVHIDRVLATGESFTLSYALNLSRGGRLVSLAHEIDECLLKHFDNLSHYTKGFYYGRYDIRCESVASLKAGEFSILEYNGSGAEPHHIYGDGNTLFQAYRIVLQHWNVLYKISRYNHVNRQKQWPHHKGKLFLQAAKSHFRVLKQLDSSLEL